MKLGDDEPQLRSMVANATAMAQEPWRWSRTDLRRSQRILRAAGINNIADGLQSFIDEPGLPLGRAVIKPREGVATCESAPKRPLE